MKMFAMLAVGTAFLLALLATVTSTNWYTRLAVSYQPDLERGATLYAEACASCHGVNLEGEPNWRTPGPDGRLPAPPHDATGHTWHHSDRVLLDITMRGTSAVVGRGYESNMPGFSDVYSEEELRDILEWIKSQWRERERQHQARLTNQDAAMQ